MGASRPARRSRPGHCLGDRPISLAFPRQPRRARPADPWLRCRCPARGDFMGPAGWRRAPLRPPIHRRRAFSPRRRPDPAKAPGRWDHGRRHAEARVHGHDRHQRAGGPDSGPLLTRRQGLRGREERPDSCLSQPHVDHADERSSTWHPRSTTSGTAGCSGSHSIPASRRTRTSTPSTRTTPRSAAPRRAGERRVPVPARPDDATAASSAAACRASLRRGERRGHRGGPDRGLVPAIPQPLDRRPPVRTGRRACTSAPATARASPSRTMAREAASGGITPRNPCGDPPGGVGGAMTAPTARGGRLRSQSLRRPAGEPVVLNGTILRVDPATGAALPTNPLFAQPDRQCPTDRRLRPAQSIPLHDPPGNERDLDGRRRRHRLGGDRPDRQPARSDRRELRLALLRGRRPARRLQGPEPRDVHVALCAAGGVAGPVLRVPPSTEHRRRRVVPATGARSSPGSPSTTGRTTRRVHGTPSSSRITQRTASGR